MKSLMQLDSPGKCFVALFLALGLTATLGSLLPQTAKNSGWSRISSEQVASGSFEVKTGPGARGEKIYYGKPK